MVSIVLKKRGKSYSLYEFSVIKLTISSQLWFSQAWILLRIRNKGEWKHIITVENEKYLQSQTKRQLGQLGRLWRILSASTICTKWMFWAGWQSALSKGIKQLRQHRVLQVTLSWHSTRWCYQPNPLSNGLWWFKCKQAGSISW